jgi:lipopolysaccharide biosynthesis protein
MVHSLIPKNMTLQKKIADTLSHADTGIIGPKNQYTSLTVNFEANGSHMTNIIRTAYSKEVARKVLQIERTEYGFFAGTMFWVRLDSVKPLLKLINARRYESESGQIDATFAHALERLLCIVPEISSKKIYQLQDSSIEQVSYNSGVVPDWSKVYIGPKAD